MNLGVIASALAYAGIWIIFMISPARRSFRSVLFLALTSVPLGLAATLDGIGFWALIGTVAALWFAGLWDLNDVLAPMPSSEVSFDRRLWEVRERVLSQRRGLRLTDWDVECERHLQTLLEGAANARELSPPSESWRDVQQAVLRALQFDISVFSAERAMNSASASASIARWEGVDRQWADVRRRRSHFWRLLN